MQLEPRVRKLEMVAGDRDHETLPLYLAFNETQEAAARRAIECITYPENVAGIIRIRGVRPALRPTHGAGNA